LSFLRCYPAWRVHWHGCDVDREAIEWLRTQGEQNVDVCGDEPPLPFADGYFGGLYAFSVLTHIPPPLHRAWYAELARVLAPGARALVTLKSEWSLAQLPPDVRAEFDRQGFVFRRTKGHYKHLCLVSEEFTRGSVEGLFEVERYGAGTEAMQFPVILKRS
jgi:SAM-dependent methyltransferase